MNREALIWRKSVYDNKFRCTLCGTILARDGNPEGYAAVRGGDILQCGRCRFVVGVYQVVDVPAEAHGCLGNYDEYERRQSNG